MQRKSSFTGLLITALCAVVSCHLTKQFHYVDEGGKTWEKAQQYCREKYIDLAFISNQEEADEVNRISGKDDVWIGLYRDPSPLSGKDDVWIGMYRDPSPPTEWKWSGGWNSTFRFWGEDQPNNLNGNQECVSLWKREMNDDQCTVQYPFVCFDLNVVLVQENKTWEEALEHCRENYTDLTSLLSENEQLQVQRMMNSNGAQTDHVWTGLIFLAKEWLWVNGDQLEYQAWTEGRLPHCPAQHLRLH
ncbi:unnamed protein product [Coregonus sp. 'balchen']|nr:unnamed protein product [Coregonus sp. 'balchen']